MCGKDLTKPFNLLVGAVKHVEACLSAREDRESGIHHCRGTVRLAQAYLCATVLTSEEVLGSTWTPVYVPENIDKAVFTTVEAL